MTSNIQRQTGEVENQFLASLRAKYLELGYTFIIDPSRDDLPSFLGKYKPDAIALKSDEKIAIEVKSREHPAFEQSLSKIRSLFEGQGDWRFVVTYSGSDPEQLTHIPTATKNGIHQNLVEVRKLLSLGQRRAAFVMAWSLLEATLHLIENDPNKRPRTPGTVIQSLAMLGYIEPELERRIAALIKLRNRIVHGDIEADPSESEAGWILQAVEQALDAVQ